MLLPIVNYGHPVLRQRGELVDPQMEGLSELIDNMLETMYEAHGLGLAAQQVDRALQLTVIDVKGSKDRPSQMWIDGAEVKVEDHMPMALLNPQIKPEAEWELGQEGCLSFPEIYGDVNRPHTIEVEALQPDGSTLKFRCNGLLARAVQHETDHLNGILFIDRMDRKEKDKIRDDYEYLHAETKAALKGK
jgi:peptide deformylase